MQHTQPRDNRDTQIIDISYDTGHYGLQMSNLTCAQPTKDRKYVHTLMRINRLGFAKSSEIYDGIKRPCLGELNKLCKLGYISKLTKACYLKQVTNNAYGQPTCVWATRHWWTLTLKGLQLLEKLGCAA